MATICKLCKKDFKYSSKLKRHHNGEYGCKYIDNNDGTITMLNKITNVNVILNCQPSVIQPVIEQPSVIQTIIEQPIDINNNNNIINNNTNNKKNIIINESKSSCIKCNKEFTTKYSLARHINEKRCSVDKAIKKNKSKNNITTNNIQHLPHTHAQDLPPPPIQQQVNNNTNNTNNINNININNTNNINNGIINNYITNVHINPFGLESTDFLTLDQKKDILISSGDMAGIKILAMAYNKRQNKNFFKSNKKNSHITYINKDYELNVLEEQAFKKKIYSNSVNLLYSIFLDCLHSLTFEERMFVSDNINYIENDMYAEIFTNGLSNVKKEMNGELNQVIKQQTDVNNSTNKIVASYFINNISNKEYLELSNREVNKQIEKKKNIDKQKICIGDNINTILNGKINLNDLARELQMKHYIDSDFYKHLIAKEREEELKLKDKNNIGLYKKYSDIKKNRELKIKEVINLETNIDKLKSYYSELID